MIPALPYESLQQEIAKALSWPRDLVVVDGSPEPQRREAVYLDADQGGLRGIVRLAYGTRTPIGSGVEDRETISVQGYRTVTQVRWRNVILNAQVFSYDPLFNADDLAAEIESHLNLEGVRKKLLRDGLSLVDFNQITNLPFAPDAHVLTSSLLEISTIVAHTKVDETAEPNTIATVGSFPRSEP